MSRIYTLALIGTCGVLACVAVASFRSTGEAPVANPAPIAAAAEARRAHEAMTTEGSGPPPAPAAVASPGEEMSSQQLPELRAEVKRLAEEFGAFRREVQARLAALPRAETEAEEEPIRGDPHTDPRALAEARRQEAEQAQALEHDFRTASLQDSQWIAYASAALEQAFASKEAADAQVSSLECRSQQCRVALLVRAGADSGDVLHGVSQQLTEMLSATIVSQVEQTAGGTAMVLHLFGKDYEPPQNEK